MNRSAKDGARSSLHYGGEGVLIHPSYQGVCGRHGTEDLGVTPALLARIFWCAMYGTLMLLGYPTVRVFHPGDLRGRPL